MTTDGAFDPPLPFAQFPVPATSRLRLFCCKNEKSGPSPPHTASTSGRDHRRRCGYCRRSWIGVAWPRSP
jgi:hypothetical protein